MAEVSVGGISFKGGKMFGVLIKIESYTAPDLSGFDKKIALSEAEMHKRLELIEKELEMIQGEMSMILQEVQLVAGVSSELKNDLKTDLRSMNSDIRHITEIVNDVEDRQKADTRELLDELKLIEENLDLKINKALNNPLAGMSAKTK